MKQAINRKRWIVIGLVLLGLLSMTTGVLAANAPSEIVIKQQIVQKLITQFADPDCDEIETNSQQIVFTLRHPLPDCWLVMEAQTASNQNLDKGVKNER